MTERPFIAMVGSINMDLAVTTARVPLVGENLLARNLKVGLGGKGANPAVALARMGAASLLVACVGEDDFGQKALDTLSAEGVSTSGIAIVRDTPTGVALIMVDDQGENTILVVIGANARLTREMVDAALDPHWERLDALAVSFEIPEPCVALAVRAGRSHGVPVIVDAGPPREYGPDTWGGATILSPNALEVESLVDYPIEDDASARRAARELLLMGPDAVVLKLGERGAILCTDTGLETIPAFNVRAVDTTGAGDAFTAGLALAVAERRPLREAVRFANAAGAITVTRMGTMTAMPTRREIEGLLATKG